MATMNIVDDTSPYIAYEPSARWAPSVATNSTMETYKQTIHTRTSGKGSVTLRFRGKKATALLAPKNPDVGSPWTYSFDGSNSTSEFYCGPTNATNPLSTNNVTVVSETDGEHTFVIMKLNHTNDEFEPLMFDYFSVDGDALPIDYVSSSSTPDNSLAIKLGVGVSLGVVLFLFIFGPIVLLQRRHARRRQKPLPLGIPLDDRGVGSQPRLDEVKINASSVTIPLSQPPTAPMGSEKSRLMAGFGAVRVGTASAAYRVAESVDRSHSGLPFQTGTEIWMEPETDTGGFAGTPPRRASNVVVERESRPTSTARTSDLASPTSPQSQASLTPKMPPSAFFPSNSHTSSVVTSHSNLPRLQTISEVISTGASETTPRSAGMRGGQEEEDVEVLRELAGLREEVRILREASVRVQAENGKEGQGPVGDERGELPPDYDGIRVGR